MLQNYLRQPWRRSLRESALRRDRGCRTGVRQQARNLEGRKLAGESLRERQISSYRQAMDRSGGGPWKRATPGYS